MLFPAGEVSNMPCALNICCPCLLCFIYHVVQLDGKEHKLPCLMLFTKSGLYLFFYPRTGYRVLRENKQKLIIQPNRLINAHPELIADFEIFRGKPAPDILALQVGIEAFGKVLIFTGVAY